MNICKTKTLRTNQLFVQDNYKTLIQNIRNRFERLTVIAKKKHPNTFSYTPWVHRAAAQQSQMSQQYQAQLSQKQAQYESFMSRFQAPPVTPAQQPPLSTTVTNAANAVAVACKQAASGALVAQLDNTIGYKSPKYLAELKILKERQAKLPPPPPPPPAQAQAQPVAALPQQVVVNSAQVVGGTVVVVDSSQPVVQVLLTSQYSSSIIFSYLTRRSLF